MKTTSALNFERAAAGEPPETRVLRIDELARLPFFAGLGTQELKEIATHTKYASFAPGETIMTQGDAADRFYIVLSGKARVMCNLPDIQLHVEDIGAGGVIGFSWLFMPERVHFSSVALEPVKAVFVYGTLLRSAFEKMPRLAYEMATRTGKVMLERLEAVVEIIGGVRFVDN